MARTLKPETIIRKQMQSFIDANGIDEETKITTEDGNFFYIMPANRFGNGYIRLNLATGEKWAANFGDKTLHPKRQKHLENFFSK